MYFLGYFFLYFLLCVQSKLDARVHIPLQGTVQGIEGTNVNSWLGIPFAAPPVGPLRWKHPQTPSRWSGVKETNTPTLCAPQDPYGFAPGLTIYYNDNVNPTEDCLHLNVFSPNNDNSKKPVLVYFHGGGYFFGANANKMLDGVQLAEDENIVVVNINYRLGALGWLAHPHLSAEDPLYPSSGNYGFLDQRKGLQWINQNIHLFGGDPAKVTISGQSAGGVAVAMHLASPGSAGLFHQAIQLSGPACLMSRTLEQGYVAGNTLQEAVGCSDSSFSPAEVLACLRAASPNALMAATPPPAWQFNHIDGFEFPTHYCQSIWNGTARSWTGATKPLLQGTTLSEGNLFTLPYFPTMDVDTFKAVLADSGYGSFVDLIVETYPCPTSTSCQFAYSDFITDFWYFCDVQAHASNNRAPTYGYIFNYTASYNFWGFPAGPTHATETPFFFKVAKSGIFDQLYSPGTPTDKAVEERFASAVASFVKTGTPAQTWPASTAANGWVRNSFTASGTSQVSGHHASQCAAIKPIFEAVYDPQTAAGKKRSEHIKNFARKFFF